jgi:hypothetical protein
MKKITLLAFLMATLLLSAQEVLNESFDTNLFLPAGWTNESSSSTNPNEVWTFSDNQDFLWLFNPGNNYMTQFAGGSGNNAVFDSSTYLDAAIVDASLTSPVFDCSGLTEVKLSYGYYILSSAIGYIGSGFVEVYDGMSWTTVAEYSEATITPDAGGYYWDYGEALLDVSTELAGVSNAQVRVRFSEITAQAWGMKIDNVVVQQPLGDAPDAVTDMIPADGATDVEIMTFLDATNTLNKMIEFSWSAATTGDPATSFDVSIGTDQTLGLGTLNNFTSGSGILYGTDTETGWMPNTTYYWKVTANNVAGSTDSAIYVFTTGADDPLGVNDVTIETFKAFPNPVIDILTIEGNKPIDSVEIVNQLGQSVLKVDLNSMFNNQINLSKLNTGIYFVKVKSASKTEILQVIKQ